MFTNEVTDMLRRMKKRNNALLGLVYEECVKTPNYEILAREEFDTILWHIIMRRDGV